MIISHLSRASLFAASVSLFVPGLSSAATPEQRVGEVIETPSAAEVEAIMPAGTVLGGRELYDRFLKNKRRLRSAYQRGRILSTDPAGNPQLTEFWLRWKDYRDSEDNAVEGVYTKSLFRIIGPYEMRHVGYLYIERSDRDDEQFMYSPSRQRTSRVRLTGQQVAGTDFAFDDFLVSLDDIEDADYIRHADEVVQGVSCYVVEAIMKPGATSAYSRSIGYLEKEHYVPLRTRYWDDVGVEVKLIVSVREKIREFDGAWIPTETTGTDLLEGTHSTLHIDVLDANPELDELAFALSRLAYIP